MGKRLEEYEVKQIIDLYNGKGRPSPSGKTCWTYDELAEAYGVGKSTIGNYIRKAGGGAIDRTVDVQAMKEQEAVEITKARSKILAEINKRDDLSGENLGGLTYAMKNLGQDRNKIEQAKMNADLASLAREALNKASTKRMHDAKKGKDPKDMVIDVDHEEVENE